MSHVVHGPRLLPVQSFSADLKELLLYPIADLHYGNTMQNHSVLKATIQEIKETENAYWVGLGDYLELNGKKQTHAGVYHDTIPPEEQMEMFVKDFTPIANKCLGLIDGNHDFRISKDWGISPTKWCAKAMNIADELYVADGALLRIRLGKRTSSKGRRQKSGKSYCDYVVYMTHGSSATATSSGKVSGLQKAGDGVVADVIMGGHVHSEFVFRDRIYSPTMRDTIQSTYKDRWYVNSGSFLEYGGYALTARYRPQPMGCPVIYFNGTKEEINIKM